MTSLKPLLLVAVLSGMGCASVSGSKRLAIGVAVGAGVGGTGGALLSPNSESRALNALVFGLSGALLGGGLAVVTEPHPTSSHGPSSLRARESELESVAREFQVKNDAPLPDFVKRRLTPVVVEEFTERDSLQEDGTLHEPHKVYRIVRPAELVPQGSVK